MCDSNRGQYEADGTTALQPYADKPATMSYYSALSPSAELSGPPRAPQSRTPLPRPNRQR